MMKNKGFAAAAILALGLVLAPMSVNAEETKTTEDYFTSEVSCEKTKITVSLNLEANSGLTSAQTVVFYDADKLKLAEVVDESEIEIADINKEYKTEDGRTGISFAWADTKATTAQGEILSLVFKVRFPYSADESYISVETLEAYKIVEEEVLPVPTPSTPESNTSSESESSTPASSSGASSSSSTTVTVQNNQVKTIVAADAELQTINGVETLTFSFDQSAILKMKTFEAYHSNTLMAMMSAGKDLGITFMTNELPLTAKDINISYAKTEVKNFAAGFTTYKYAFKEKSGKLGFKMALHMNVGSEYAGKTAYIFVLDSTTNSYVLKKSMTVNVIGNVAENVDELSEVWVLVQN